MEDRNDFIFKTYLLFALWLVLALAQWLLVCLDKGIGKIFLEHYYICIGTFVVAISLFGLLFVVDGLRSHRIASLLLTVIIAELQIVSLFTLVAHTYWSHLIISFIICVAILVIFAAIANFLPEKYDLTAHIAMMFIVSFILLLVAIFYLMMHLLTVLINETHDYSFMLVELPITVSILLSVMYHAQIITGGRFDEMRVEDFFFASLTLFHDFLIIYWLTFNWLVYYLQKKLMEAAQKNGPIEDIEDFY